MRETPENLRRRHSVRAYDGRPLAPADAEAVNRILSQVSNGYNDLSFRLFVDNGEPFKSFKRSYGFFKGVANYIAVTVEQGINDAQERAGFLSQLAVTEFTRMGLGTCYVAATFDSKHVDMKIPAGHELLCLITIGYGLEKRETAVSSLIMKFAHRKSRAAEDFYDSSSGISLTEATEAFPTLQIGLEGLVSAPSQLNKQPVRIRAEKDNSGRLTLHAYLSETYNKVLADLGIAKFNFAAAAGGRWQWGDNGEYIPE